MAEDHHDHEPDVSPELPAKHRTTSPQSSYSNREVAVGFVVLAVGVVLTFALAIALV